MDIYTSDNKYWWLRFQADPKPKFDDITLLYSKKKHVSCQYYVNGLPAVCKYWTGSYCSYIPSGSNDTYPNGYSRGDCDFLGRRNWCNKYEPRDSEQDDDGWCCIAISPEWSGLFVNEVDEYGKYYTRKVEKDELEYCADESTGSGKCDGWGCGRGCEAPDDIEKVLEMPIKCKFYKPWMLGFGAIEPQNYERAIREYQFIYDKSYEYFIENPLFERRLPFSFEVYNLRALSQPCAYWEGTPSMFQYHHIDGSLDYIELPGAQGRCTKNQSYATKSSESNDSLTREVWSEENTIICNGAKPECPLYTGEWKYCNDEYMLHGTPITALQILELRFWMKYWNSQEEYDRFFEDRPNWTDETTPDILTFAEWDKQDLIDTSKSVMKGFRFSMCQPVPENVQKKFDTSVYVTVAPVVYPPLNVDGDIGTTTEQQLGYPSLIRKLPRTIAGQCDLVVIYPYKNNNVDALPCKNYMFYCERRSNNMEGDFVSVVGNARGASQVFVMNLNHVIWPYPYSHFFEEYDDIDSIPSNKLNDFYSYINKHIYNIINDNSDYVISRTPADQGIFITPPRLPLDYNESNDILILAFYPDNGVWNFKKRRVFSKFYGGVITQNSFTYDSAQENFLPEIMLPSGKATISASPIGSSMFSTCFVLRSGYTNAGTCNPAAIHTNYTLEVVEEAKKDVTRALRIGHSNYLWIEIDDINLNYIFNWVFIEGSVIVEDKITGDSKTISLERVYPIGDDIADIYMDSKSRIRNYFRDATPTIEKLSIPPNAFVVKPSEDVSLFGVSESDISVTYRYYKLCFTDEDREASIGRVFPPESIWSDIGSDTYPIECVPGEEIEMRNSNVTAMGFFTDEDGRAIVAFATNLYAQVNRTISRNVELFYSYKGEGDIMELQPQCGSFATYVAPPKRVGTGTRGSTPLCGSHLYYGTWPGYLWFPYNKCTTMERYQIWGGASFCLDEIEPMSMYGAINPSNNRHRGPHSFYAFTGLGCPLHTCAVLWEYFNMEIKSNAWDFDGTANIVSCVDTVEYLSYGWDLPPFGNMGRDYFERYMSKDYSNYLVLEYGACNLSVALVPKSRWMPAVIDHKTFYFSFNCFNYLYSLREYCFNTVDQMQFFNNTDIGESVNLNKRYRWEDIFEVDGILGYYPPLPVLIDNSLYTYFYYFKDDNHIWAWPEKWLDIERDLGGSPKIECEDEDDDDEDTENSCEVFQELSFLNISKPYYWYNLFKEEIRFILDEGEYSLVYKKPEFKTMPISDEYGNISEQDVISLPSISINGCNPRCFEIIYDEYDDSIVDWVDSCDCQCMCEGQHIYERTMEYPWDWFTDIIYGPDAACTESEAEANGTMYYDPPDPYGNGGDFTNERGFRKRFYNRGLVIHIPKSALAFLPMEFENVMCTQCDGASSGGCCVVYEDNEDAYDIVTFGDSSSYLLTLNESNERDVILDFSGVAEILLGDLEVTEDDEKIGIGIKNIKIKGYWGIHKYESDSDSYMEDGYYYYCKPSITISKYTQGAETIEMESIEHESPLGNLTNMQEFTIEREYMIYPNDMFTNSALALILSINKPPSDLVVITSVEVTKARYCDAAENIYVWERMYNVAEGGVGDNVFGTKHNLKPEPRDPMVVFGYEWGPFYNFMNDPDLDKDVVGLNKIYGVFGKAADIDRFDKRNLHCNRSNMYDIEYEEQKKLYTEPQELDYIGDELHFSPFCPPILTSFYKDVLHSNPNFNIPTFVSTSEKVLFDDHSLARSYNKPVFWQPGGHYFEWGESVERVNCYFNKPMIVDRYHMEFNCVRHGTPNCTMGPANSYYTGRYAYQMMWYDLEYGGLGIEPGLDLVTNSSMMGGFGEFADSAWEWGVRKKF